MTAVFSSQSNLVVDPRRRRSPGASKTNTQRRKYSSRLLILGLLRFAHRAPLQAMEQPPPPVPLLSLRQVLVLEPSGVSQFLAKIRVADPHRTGLLNRHCNSGPMHLCSLTCWRSAPMVRSFRPTVASSSLSSWTKRSRSQLWKASSMALVKSESVWSVSCTPC